MVLRCVELLPICTLRGRTSLLNQQVSETAQVFGLTCDEATPLAIGTLASRRSTRLLSAAEAGAKTHEIVSPFGSGTESPRGFDGDDRAPGDKNAVHAGAAPLNASDRPSCEMATNSAIQNFVEEAQKRASGPRT